ncbi:hypothetical protein Ccrd_016209 [Cynara cardunculus var. scolymus]|uniref:Uncharacterized protein n=1 Tax=Cynara cardunculus var. scolymus TaxID=59895 RepID=A0A118K357_CYNCS|nr:hypothetical protein Ccrd_016209 [Cynara cardunculus var. scolymus]
MMCLVSRTGRDLQRYDMGRRLVVGCIPYRFKNGNGELEVLVISSQKGHAMMFPKMKVEEAREVCQSWWMKEALDVFVERLTSTTTFIKPDLLNN